MGEIVGAGELLGDDHAPSVDDELAGLGTVQCRKLGVDPVEAHVRRRRHLELVRLTRDERRALLLGEREAHYALVAGERHVDDLLDAELQPAAYVYLIRALQPLAQRPNVLDHRHAQNPSVMTRARPSVRTPFGIRNSPCLVPSIEIRSSCVAYTRSTATAARSHRLSRSPVTGGPSSCP